MRSVRWYRGRLRWEGRSEESWQLSCMQLWDFWDFQLITMPMIAEGLYPSSVLLTRFTAACQWRSTNCICSTLLHILADGRRCEKFYGRCIRSALSSNNAFRFTVIQLPGGLMFESLDFVYVLFFSCLPTYSSLHVSSGIQALRSHCPIKLLLLIPREFTPQEAPLFPRAPKYKQLRTFWWENT